MRTTQRTRRRIHRKSRSALPTAGGAKIARSPTLRPVLVATDGSRPASAAIGIARLMADRGAWAPEVITVCEPLPTSLGELTLPVLSGQQEVALTNSILVNVKRQLCRYGAASWKFAVQFGRAAPSIVRAATEDKAELIVLGLGQHGAIARLLGAETVTRVLRHTDIPVIAVHPSARRLPSVALVAVDFGDSSLRAAREALALLEPPGRLHLVHVKWGYNFTSLRDAEWERAYAFGVEEGFSRVRSEIGTRQGIEITTEFLHGAVVETILGTAKSIGAALVALGSQGQTVFDRLVIGSTPAQVLRAASCSVLIAPPTKSGT